MAQSYNYFIIGIGKTLLNFVNTAYGWQQRNALKSNGNFPE